MIVLSHSYFMALRLLRQLLRQPWWIALTLAQPVIWLVFYGQLFKGVANLPGFQATSYITFLTPGIVTMSALFSSGWSGMGILRDLDFGVMDRFLVSPVSRVAIIAGRLLHLAFTTVVQSSILITLGFVLGARYPGGIGGIFVLIGCAVLVGVSFGALSNALALTMRKMESVIGAVNFILLPMTFLSSILMANTLMPPWIRKVSLVNPVNWAVEAGRTAISESPDWTAVLIRVACITTFALVCGWVATRAFRSYQRSA